jgi:hypothetical protein
MIKKVIVLWGRANTGKSCTVKRVFELLTSSNLPDTQSDIMGILTTKADMIGIISQGDPNTMLRSRLSFLIRLGCTIIVCVTRGSGKTVEVVEALRERYKCRVMLWLRQNKEVRLKSQKRNNDVMAIRIVEEIERAVFWSIKIEA